MTTESGIWVWFANIDPRIWQAVLAGIFVASGWLYNGWQNRRGAAALRAERLRDVHRALYAEIGANLAILRSSVAIIESGNRILQLMEEDTDYHPFIARQRNMMVFETIVADIHILPRTSVDAVVNYYAQIKRIDELVADLRSDTVRSLSKNRRMAIYRDYTEMRQQAFAFGNHALVMINAYATGGKDNARRVEAQINNLRGGRPDGP